MYKKIGITILLLSVVSAGSLLVATNAKAQDATALGLKTLTIVPPTVNANVNPGDKTEGTIKLINDSDNSLTFAADTQDFIVTDLHGLPNILPPNTYANKYSAAAWLAVSPSTFTISAHQSIILNYYMQVPANARPGGHYAAVLFKPANIGGALNSTGATVQTDIGTLFSVHIAGPITEKATITSITAPKFSEYGPITITTDVKNSGDSDITPQGTVTFYNIFGQKVGSSYIDSHRIFPEAVREFTNSFGQKWTVGKFTAKLMASYGQANNLPLSAEVTFVIFPWKVASVGLLVVIVLVLVALVIWRRRKGKDVPPTGVANDQQPMVNDQPVTPETKTA